MADRGATKSEVGVGELAKGRIGTWGIVYFVVSAAAPLTVAAATGLSIRIGGIGVSGAVLACGLVLILFALGFTAMTKYVRNAGAFYAYVTRGLGRDAGNGVAMMTCCAYGVMLAGFYGFMGFYAAGTMNDVFGIGLPWGVWACLVLLLVGVLGYRQVDVGAKLIGALLTAEVLILVALSIAVIAQGGPEPVSFAPFSPHNVFFATGAGGLFVVGFGAYIGFEGTAIYAEEAKSAERSVPRATYIAIGFLAVFYAFASWILIEAFGVKGTLALAQSDAFGDMIFQASDTYLNHTATQVMHVLIVTSFVAAIISFHNACARYLFSMGRSGLLPRVLGRTHPRTHSPYVASVILSAIVGVVVLGTIASGGDPYLNLGLWTYAPGVVGIISAQTICAIAVIVFFGRDRRDHSVWRVQIAPALGAIGLTLGLYLIVTNFGLVSGQVDWANWLMIGFAPVAFVAGVIRGRVVGAKGDGVLNLDDLPSEGKLVAEA